jgi:putative membrane protein insertion efficiency factor
MLKSSALKGIGIYQKYISKALPSTCRFYPSCSQYAKEAILKYGFYKGIAKAIVRILSCHPLSGKSGYDPLI